MDHSESQGRRCVCPFVGSASFRVASCTVFFGQPHTYIVIRFEPGDWRHVALYNIYWTVWQSAECCHCARCQVRMPRRNATLAGVSRSCGMMFRLYCDSVTAGASSTQLRRLQSVLNAAARLVCSASKYESVTWLLRQLHWLKVPRNESISGCVC